jgi:hypothetical protein
MLRKPRDEWILRRGFSPKCINNRDITPAVWNYFFDSLITYIQIGASVAAVIALVFNGVVFQRSRKTEQVRLVDGFLIHLRTLTQEYNMAANAPIAADEDPFSYQAKLHRMLDHIFGALNWISFLILTGEIKDPRLVDYFRGYVIDNYDKFYLPHQSEFPEYGFQHFRELYDRYKKNKYPMPAGFEFVRNGESSHKTEREKVPNEQIDPKSDLNH